MAVNYQDPSGGGSRLSLDNPKFVGLLNHDLTNLEDTLPPTPLRELLAASGATVTLLATDREFIETIERAAGDQYPVAVVGGWAELLRAVEEASCGIALLDAAVLGRRVIDCVHKLAKYTDRLVVLVAAERAVAHEFVGLLSDRQIHRLLIKPTAVGAARLLIESAVTRRLQLRELASNDPVHEPAAVSRKPPQWLGWVAAGGVAMVLLGVVALVARLDWWEGLVEPSAAVSPAAAPAPAADSGPSLGDLRARAELAVQEGRLAEPVGDSALDHYLAALAIAPADEPARRGVAMIVEALLARAEGALRAESLPTAAAALDQVRRVEPASSRLALLDAQLERLLAAQSVAAPAPPPTEAAPVPAVPTELDSVLSIAAVRLDRGDLLSPAGDSAADYLARATQLAAGDPRVAALRASLGTRLVAAARLLANADLEAAERIAAEARRLGIGRAGLATLDADIAAAKAQRDRQQLAEVEELIGRGALFAPAGASAVDALTRLQESASETEGLADAWAALRQAAAVQFEAALARRDWAEAETVLAALAPAGAEATGPLAAELAAQRLQETYLATPAAPSELTLRSSVPAVYPAEAIERGQEGWVDVEFVVDAAGVPRNVAVVRPSQVRRFDEAALAAVSQYRYAPFERDGRVYERRVRVRVRFDIQ